MKTNPLPLTCAFCVLLSINATAAVRYVNVNNATPASPYTSWNTAAVTIQQAVDASAAGDQIVVTNGVYQTGGQTVHGSVLNRVALTKAVTVQSVNGAAFTTIIGYTGGGTVRCAYLTNGAALRGFTLTNGVTGWDAGFTDSTAGGVWGETNSFVSDCVIVGNTAEWAGGVFRVTVTNCVITGNTARWPGGGGGATASVLYNCAITNNSAGVDGGGADQCVLTACILSGNSAIFGGGARESVLHSCTVTNNTASTGGGAVTSTLDNCLVKNNSAPWGGGVAWGNLTNCVLSWNSAGEGGGAYGGTLTGCTISGNTAGIGGGVSGSELRSCVVYGNFASAGGGAYSGSLTNCTLTGNSASSEGGGVYSSVVYNSIAFYNLAPVGSNHSGATMVFSCTTPLPGLGSNNITSEPVLADFAHLTALSPCRATGSAAFTSGVDVDGEPWANPPSIGCDEFIAGSITGALSVAISASYTNVATQFTVSFTPTIGGHAGANRWDFGDGTVVSNQLYLWHSWPVAGNYPVTLTAYNESNPGGISATVMVSVLQQPVHYVSLNSTNPVPPYFSWATAATNIQDAVDVAYPGGTVLVSNGVYQTGGRVAYGSLTNRLVVTRPVTVQSANGPVVTAIQGNPTNGDSAVRCVYLTNGVALSGFTLTQGATRMDGDGAREQSGGGVYCESVSAVVSNCILVGNLANYLGGGAYGGTFNNCTLTGNSASYGAGASTATLNHSTLSTNLAYGAGGGMHDCTLNFCTVAGNTAGDSGGGAYLGRINDSTLIGNWATNSGGGAQECTLSRCVITSNTALGGYGGGVNACALDNCTTTHNSAVTGGGANSGSAINSVFTGNYASNNGGGASGSALNNCTLTGNSAYSGGGTDAGTLFNCLLYFNHAVRNDNYTTSAALNYCCTAPSPLNGTNNIDADPQLVSDSHLSSASPCRAAGSMDFASGVDIDGQAWANPPAIGCDEFYAGSLTGALSVVIEAGYTNVAAGFLVDFAALIVGSPGTSRWDFGDGTVVSNQPYSSHSWSAAGDYAVTLTAYNSSNPGGISATVLVHVVVPPVHYVSLDSTNPVAPFTAWNTAATNIQDAVDAATATGALVLVSNGTYQTGGRLARGGLSNRLAVVKPVLVQSVNGPAFTAIRGEPTNGDLAMRCVYLTNNATLSGFTLTLGATLTGGDSDFEQSGGGVWCEFSSAVVSNCVVTLNTANYGGGGVSGGSLFNCVLSTNTAGGLGGGAYASSLNNCTLTGNSGYYGGGASSSVLTGCTLNGNSAPGSGGGATASTLTLCIISSNSSWGGGGVDGSKLDRCTVRDNSANYGAGAANSTLRNSVLTGNTAKFGGGGADNCTINNCTVTGNSAGSYGGGVSGGVLNNCIVFYNSAWDGSNYFNSTSGFSCTLPLPPGAGNIGVEPQLADLAHLSAGSPCRSAGSAAFSSSVDIDGEAWANPPSIGCDEYVASAATGGLAVAISPRFTNVIAGLGLDFIAQITGHATASRWEFGDGTVLSNRPYASHSWAALGDYPVVLRVFNDSFPAGISATVTVHVVTQPVHYVAVSNGTPVSPFTSWATAATNIQDAVDAVTTAGALVLVSNGVYTGTARLVNNDVPHRLVVDKPITVQSVNGPDATVIKGQPYAGAYGAIRCAYLVGGASLFGFTLTNGVTFPGYSESYPENMFGGGVWCDSLTALVSNCVIVACAAGYSGGGAYGGTLVDCLLTNNGAYDGGGAFASVLKNCALLGNSANSGGGAHSSTLIHCTLERNAAGAGGGAYGSGVSDSSLTGNRASNGGAADSCSVSNSSLTGNVASNTGGGANAAALFNCTVTGNAAANSGGGVSSCTNFNSLVYYNLAPAGSNWVSSTFDHACTSPLPPDGFGNTAAEPQLADAFHLSAGSPCRAAGSPAYASGNDLDGEPWLNPPSIGCDEFIAGAINGPVSVSILAPYTDVAAGYTLSLQALIGGHASASVWDFGDGSTVSNRPFTAHTWTVPGDYAVVLRAFNESFPSGVSTSVTIHVQSPIHYVALGNPAPVAPYSSWATAATSIQDAVDAAFVGGTIIVSNGIYESGGRVASGSLSNRIAVTRQMTLQSVNGPAATVIRGNQPNGANAVRCASLVRGVTLIGFTLSNGGTRTDGEGDLDQTGAGVWCDSLGVVISNCIITANTSTGGGAGAMRGTFFNCTLSSNSLNGAANSVLNHCSIIGNAGGGAGGCTLNYCLVNGNSGGWGGGGGGGTWNNCVVSSNSASYGGGAYATTFNNCLLIGNTAYQGGGTYNCWMNNCTLVGNSASGHGGGAFIAGSLYNCILYYNSAPNGPNYFSDYLSHCCTTPFYAGGPGNITNAPLFVNLAGGDFRLQTGSPCINSGYNPYAPAGVDLDGNPRIVSGAVDIGAYEFQMPGSQISYAWLEQYGLPTAGSADFADNDGDGHTTWQEWRAGTIPTDALSALRMLNPLLIGSDVIVRWESVINRNYFLQRGADLAVVPGFLTLQTNIAGQAGTTSYMDTNAAGTGPIFYRVGVQE